MKKILLLICFACWVVMSAFSQNVKISGTLIDRDTKDGVMLATVQMLKSDSTYVKGVLSDDKGNFSIDVSDAGNYILKFTSVGYTTMFKNVKVSGKKDVALGNIVFGADAIMLKEATVVGQAARVTVKEDTFIYNASAYRTPEGSVVEELVKRIPGAQVSDDGTVTINGQEVTRDIRLPKVAKNVSAVAAIPTVRQEMTKQQRQIAAEGGIVMDGRDIGTTVLPHAPVKIFMVATAHERARRRYLENKQKGITTTSLEELQRAIELRDQKDSTRKVSPLTQASDAIRLDTTNLTIDEVVAEISKIIKKTEKHLA